MSYHQWFETHAAKHRKIVQKLSHLSDQEVIEYFRFENMVVNENDFCPLYTENKKCHDIEMLNCYLCACPYFRFNDEGFASKEGRILFSSCSIKSPDGERYITATAIHQNCAGCLIPHRESTIKSIFDRDWLAVMKEVPCETKRPGG